MAGPSKEMQIMHNMKAFNWLPIYMVAQAVANPIIGDEFTRYFILFASHISKMLAGYNRRL
jgi:hypothetical protein